MYTIQCGIQCYKVAIRYIQCSIAYTVLGEVMQIVKSCCSSHSAHWLPTRKKLLYTVVANPARGLLNREKKKKKKSGSVCVCCCCCCCLHIKSRSDLYSVLSNIRTGPTDADAFRGHRLTTQKGYTYQKEIKGPRKVNTHAII